MAFLFRRAHVEDAEVVLGIIQAAFAEYQDTVPVPPGALSDTLDDVRKVVAEGRTLLAFSGFPPGHEFIGSFADSIATLFATPVGTVRYEVRPDYLYVGRLAVLPEYRGRGIGAVLMRHIEELAPSLGRTRLRLGSRCRANLAFYERLGYRAVEREPHPHGPDINVWFEKELEGVSTPSMLVQEVMAKVEPLMGKALDQVRYWCLGSDMSGKSLDAPFPYIGGEVELYFPHAGSLFISWQSNRGWGGAYSVGVSNDSHFLPGSLELFDANSTSTWKPLIGSNLTAVDVLGWDSVPYILKLVFPVGIVYVGSGMQHGFGDGDDTLICSEDAWQVAEVGEPQVLAYVAESGYGSEGRSLS